MAGGVSLTDAQVRLWLRHYYRFDKLDDPTMRSLLRLHGRPHEGTPRAVSDQARALLRDKIEVFKPSEEAPPDAWRTYRVLVGYTRREKLYRDAWALSVSERQASRERARALSLLRQELEVPES